MRRMKLTAFYTVAILCAMLSKVSAQQVFKTTSTSTIAYYEYVPQNYNNTSDKYPIVIFLHGIGERGPNTTDLNTLKSNIYKVAKIGPPQYVKDGNQFPFILISPQLKSNYGSWPASYVMEVINHVKSYLRIDERRIYLTGLSLGGGGAWVTAQDNPKLFAALAPVCGASNSPSKAGNIAPEIPVWAFHGDKDNVVPLARTVNMVNAINAYTPHPNPLAKITIYAGVTHNAWTKAYKTDHSVHTPNVYEWMLSKTNLKNAGNLIPIAKAGSDQTKALSKTSSATLTGSGSDGDGSIVSYTWTKISGPSATLSNASTSTLKVTKLQVGTYFFRLKVSDNKGNTDSDYVKLTVTK